ncbi:putative serine/threonine-protein kinase-like protein CCR3 [Rhodamnia argentea]|uniref:non-specific serine/threonine protein kinase n=1 Tax=Rhodamnia argentea TaxID=178133 RepID=A0A8B8Q040_9MYRT|nr:putative serine/threonine-protein kinase-like protein CCR3 [Rhodamnia argentea]
MMRPRLSAVILAIAAAVLSATDASHALGTGSTIAISYSSATVCGIASAQPKQRIKCYRRGQVVDLSPYISFSAISGGANSVCGLRSGGYSFLCWDNLDATDSTLVPKRIYGDDTVLLENISVGDYQICAQVNGTKRVKCWRRSKSFFPPEDDEFASVSSGFGFSCGISVKSTHVQCWGSNSIAGNIENGFGTMPMSSVVAGGAHVCGLNTTGFVVCRGSNEAGQLDVPFNSAMEYSLLSLGANHSCAIRRLNNTVICWGGKGQFFTKETEGTYFETIASGANFTCGLTTSNFSVMCWGPGWNNGSGPELLPLTGILPGPCVQSCDCGIYTESQSLCYDSGAICKPCQVEFLTPGPPPQPPSVSPSSSPSQGLRKSLLAFAIVGSVGAFSGLCTAIYLLYTGACFGHKKIHNSVQPTITRANSNNATNSNSGNLFRSSTIRRQSSRVMSRQRSGPSSKHADRAEEFSLAELAAATNFFSMENKIGAGSFGVVYRGKLPDGGEVAIKRGETGSKAKKFQEKESAFDSELAFLSRLHHKHLVRLVGYCTEKDERLLVYEYMRNGALYDHLHDKNNVKISSSVLNSWKMRIKIALDAARGIEYLHSYADPPIIHRDIKSSNILLDSNWTARVSDFGLSLMDHHHRHHQQRESDSDQRPMAAAGTIGYIDPEYYGLNVLTAKSDVYGLGVVLLELLTGKKAIFKEGEGEGATPVSVVDYAVPAIMAGEVARVLDGRVAAPEKAEAEAVELVAYTAMHCVNLEGKDRPTMSDIAANLERALSLCQGDSHGNISSGGISIVSE